MPLPSRPLDDRSFQDLVDEAKKRIPLYCPEWTDHNVSDPGITLIELFAWMVDILLYRLNQVPERHYIKLLELLGIRLEPPRAAQVPLTFYLSAPQPEPVMIPAGTAASTSRANGGEAVVFTTNEQLVIRPAKLEHLISRQRQPDGAMRYQIIEMQRLKREFTPFTAEQPQVGDALYFGFEEPLDHHYIALDMHCLRAGGLNIIPESPPLAWQAWTAHGWAEAELEDDSTGGMSYSGQIRLHLPELDRTEIQGIEAFWVRVQVTETKPGQRPYATSPIIQDVQAATWGGTTIASHATTVTDEPLGRSDGSPGQVFRLENTPVLPRAEGERVEIWQSGMEDWEPWTEVEDFSASGPEDKHYTLDSATGEIRFGPALRQRDGSIRRYGAVPPRGADIRFSRYRYGGGVIGNVRAGAITELKSAIAYVDRVSNRKPARGGLDQETLEHAMFRARNLLRSRSRAVTPEDFEFLTLDAFRGEIARVRCLQARPVGAAEAETRPGQVYVIVIPYLPEDEATRYIPLARLALSDDLRERIVRFLDERRLLTTRLDVRPAGYKRVRVHAQVVGRPGVDEQRLERDIISALELFINPLKGGPEGTGWPFGRELYLSDLYACIQKVDGLLNVQDITMYWVDENDTPHVAQRKIDLLAHEVIVSDIHQVSVVAE